MSEIIGDMALMIISSITAKIALLAFFMTVLKYVTKRFAKTGNVTFKKADKALAKTHVFFGISMSVFAILHGITSVYSIKMISIMPFLIGLICFAACLIAIGSFYLRKKMEKPKRWIKYTPCSNNCCSCDIDRAYCRCKRNIPYIRLKNGRHHYISAGIHPIVCSRPDEPSECILYFNKIRQNEKQPSFKKRLSDFFKCEKFTLFF